MMEKPYPLVYLPAGITWRLCQMDGGLEEYVYGMDTEGCKLRLLGRCSLYNDSSISMWSPGFPESGTRPLPYWRALKSIELSQLIAQGSLGLSCKMYVVQQQLSLLLEQAIYVMAKYVFPILLFLYSPVLYCQMLLFLIDFHFTEKP